jgi:prevent-host-death family protein
MTMDTNIRGLKAHLSEYLQRVEAGDTIVVRNHNREVARIVPATADRLVERLCNTPGISGRGGKPGGMKAPKGISGRKSVAEMVAEDRR